MTGTLVLVFCYEAKMILLAHEFIDRHTAICGLEDDLFASLISPSCFHRERMRLITSRTRRLSFLRFLCGGRVCGFTNRNFQTPSTTPRFSCKYRERGKSVTGKDGDVFLIVWEECCDLSFLGLWSVFEWYRRWQEPFRPSLWVMWRAPSSDWTRSRNHASSHWNGPVRTGERTNTSPMAQGKSTIRLIHPAIADNLVSITARYES